MSQIILIMGVSGCGKSTLGEKLAEKTGGVFIEGDDLHPPSNKEKMTSGQPLTDEDRWPWFDRIIAKVNEGKTRSSELNRVQSATVPCTMADCTGYSGSLGQAELIFIGCSALKEDYRAYLFQPFGNEWRVIHLAGDFDTIYERMKSRKHFMPPSLLQSQFETLQTPEYDPAKCLTLSVHLPIDEMVTQAMEWFAIHQEPKIS